ncbi:MAG: Flp pilus assembly complex ATPase component TadA [Deltaproteobacteria bacterium]|nr:Flp pilus assembly complex ATPase component TadA [Deltaproteobacteria bacterium]
MLQITINEKGGQPRQETFDKNEITIGRVQGNDIVLPKGNISKRHSRIVIKDGKFIIVDLKSTNGTYVNGKKINAPQVVKTTDKIYIGDFTLQLNPGGGGSQSAERQASLRAPVAPAREEEIDLFGGDAPLEDAGGRSGGSPGLIDDNFDQEFEAPEPQAKLPKPSRRTALPKPVEPEPEPEPELEHELDLDADFDAPDLGESGLELDVGLEPEPEPEDDFEPEPEPPRPAALPKPTKRAPQNSAAKMRPIPRAEEEDDHLDVGDALGGATMTPTPAPELATPAPMPHLSLAPSAMTVAPAAVPAVAVAAAAAPAPAMEREEAVQHLHQQVVARLGLRGVPAPELAGMRADALAVAEEAAAALEKRGALGAGDDAQDLAQIAAARAVGVDLVADLLADDAVVEVEITSDRQVLVDRDGRLESAQRSIESEAQVTELIKTLAALGGVQAGADAPLVDVRLVDGTRVLASLPPLAFRGPSLAIRKTTRDFFTLEKLLEYNTVSQSMMTFIDYCVRFRKNMLLAVGPGVSPTATLNALLAQMPTDDRVVSVENGVELHLGGPRNLTALEPRGSVTVADLVRHAAAMQADRAVVGGLCGEGGAEVLRTLAGPLEGSVLALAAPSPAVAVERVAAAVAGELEGGIAEARRLVAMAFPVVLQEQRFLDNSRRITSVAEVVAEGEEVRAEDVFTFTAEGVDENLIVTGTFQATGRTPRFLEELVDRGEAEVDMSIFKA